MRANVSSLSLFLVYPNCSVFSMAWYIIHKRKAKSILSLLVFVNLENTFNNDLVLFKYIFSKGLSPHNK